MQYRHHRRKLSKKEKRKWAKANHRSKSDMEIDFWRRLTVAEQIYRLPPLDDMKLRRRRYSDIAVCGDDHRAKNEVIERYRKAATPAQARIVARPPRSPDRKTNVYVIGSTIFQPMKIGKADDVKVRLRELQVGSPTVLRILGVMYDVDRSMEMSLHREFSYARLHGEWFKPVPELLELVASLYGGDPEFRNELTRYLDQQNRRKQLDHEIDDILLS